jgi:fatty-acid desaturase
MNTFLTEPSYLRAHSSSSKAYRPTIKDTVRELIHALDFVHDPSHLATAIIFCSMHSTVVGLILFVFKYLTWHNFVLYMLALFMLAQFYNTLWYHRYCAHSSYSFSHPFWNKLILYLNPLFIREETYAIPHMIHHQKSDNIGDPYGPHLGRLESFYSGEVYQINTDISLDEYNLLVARIKHIGLSINSYEDFKSQHSMEKLSAYLIRMFTAQLVWSALWYSLGGYGFVTAWYAAIFVMLFLIKDFNWVGHAGYVVNKRKKGRNNKPSGTPINQRTYGYLASEWHMNHHRYPQAARTGITIQQLDFAYWVLKFLKKINIVKRLNPIPKPPRVKQ